MGTIGIGELRQDASRVVAEAASGEEFVITDRGRPVARTTALSASPLQAPIDAGRVREARRNIVELPAPDEGIGLSPTSEDMRNDERC